MSKKAVMFVLLLSISIISVNASVDCVYPAWVDCRAECAGLPSYPTYQFESCLTACADRYNILVAEYNDCEDAASAQQQADQEAAQEAAAEEAAAEAVRLAAEEAVLDFNETDPIRTSYKGRDIVDSAQCQDTCRKDGQLHRDCYSECIDKAGFEKVLTDLRECEYAMKRMEQLKTTDIPYNEEGGYYEVPSNVGFSDTPYVKVAQKERDQCVSDLAALKERLPAKEIGSLDEWRQKILDETGPDSEPSKRLAECDAAMARQVNTCKAAGKGWMVDNSMEITDFDTNKPYEYQLVEKGGCTQDQSSTVKVDTKLIDAQTDSHQVICSINCYQWDCEKPVKSRTVRFFRGQVDFLRDGKVSPVTTDLEFRAGDVIHTGGDGSVAIGSKDSTIKFGKDTVVEFIGLPFDPVPSRRIIPPPEAPWAPDPGSFKLETDDMAFWKGVADDMKRHVPRLLSKCLASIAGAADPLNPDIPLPKIPLVGCAKQHILFLVDGSLWTKSKPAPNVTREWILTQTLLIQHMTTEFTVEVAPDGTTTVTTLDGSVLVTDLTTRKSVVVGANDQLTVPKTSEQELQQSLTTIDPNSIDKWWITDTDLNETVPLPGAELVLLYSWVPALVVGLLIALVAVPVWYKKRHKKRAKGWGIASLVFGILGFLTSLIYPIGLPLSIAAIVFCHLQRKHKPTGMATAGKVLGIIGAVISGLLMTLITIAGIVGL